MKTFVMAVGAMVLIALSSPAGAQCGSFNPPVYYGGVYAVPAYPYAYPYPAPAYGYGYPAYPLYPYPLPLAPSLGFGRGGIYGHVFVPRDESITSYTFPGRNSW
jgi:hypothetical protein